MSAATFSKVLPSGEGVYTIFDMSNDELKSIEARLRPGGYSAVGFLSAKESLRDVCVRDLTTLNALGISCEQISGTLIALVKKAQQVTESNEALIGDRFMVRGALIGTNGYQLCPFHQPGKQCHKGQHDYVVTNLKTNESVSVSQLAIYLIGKHAFFEGDVSYRVDPEKVCRVLELQPGNYKTVTKLSLKYCEFGEIEEEAYKAARRYAGMKCELDSNAMAYFGLPYRDYDQYKNRLYTKIERERKELKLENTPENNESIIKSKREIFLNWDPDAPVFVDDGKKYHHIYNFQEREELLEIAFDDIEVDTKIEFVGCYVFEGIKETYADLS